MTEGAWVDEASVDECEEGGEGEEVDGEIGGDECGAIFFDHLLDGCGAFLDCDAASFGGVFDFEVTGFAVAVVAGTVTSTVGTAVLVAVVVFGMTRAE